MLEVSCITRTYGATRANDCLTATIRSGEILGLLGENGAGKSTFLSILAGMNQPDSGQLIIDGQPVTITSPRDARKLGISIVFQHFSLVPSFTVREQLRLAGWVSAELPAGLRSRFSGDEVISELSLGERQQIEIARALVSSPRYLLLDEPTSILTMEEARHLFELLRDLQREGTSVVLVTHKLHEALDVCDRVVVLRQGRNVDTVERGALGWPERSDQRLLRSMFGAENKDILGEINASAVQHAGEGSPQVSTRRRADEIVLDVKNLASPHEHGRRALHDLYFDVRKGEVCAVVGVDGEGQRELAETCAGYAIASGEITLRGQSLPPGDAAAFRHAGVAYLTDDRVGEGTVPGFSIEENLIMKRQRERPYSRFGILQHRAITAHAEESIRAWHVEPARTAAPIATLSGGNIQKVLLARELDIADSLLIVNKPSQGLDVRTRRLVWRAIRNFVDDGGSVLLLTTDVDEAFEQADRMAVIYGGKISTLEPVLARTRSRIERMMVSGWQ